MSMVKEMADPLASRDLVVEKGQCLVEAGKRGCLAGGYTLPGRQGLSNRYLWKRHGIIIPMEISKKSISTRMTATSLSRINLFIL